MQVADKVIRILERADYNGDRLVITERLDRPDYQAVNKVLEAAGGKWDKKAKAHVFPSTAYDLLDPVFVSGRIQVPKDDFEFFPTPDDLAMDLATRFHNRYGMDVNCSILEPSAGVGNLIQPFLNQNLYNEGNLKFTLVEKNPVTFKLLEAKFGNKPGVRLINADIMQYAFTGEGFDRIIMNPPFSKQQDIDHLLCVLPRLNPGGHVMAIMSSSVGFRTNKKTEEFRQMVRDFDGTIEEIPPGSFKAAGTMVNTVVVMF